MFKQLYLLLAFLLVQLIAAGPAPEQPTVGDNNPEFGRGRGSGGRGRGRDRWTWCRCRVDRWDDGRWSGRRDL